MYRESFVQELSQPSFAWHGRVTPTSHSWPTLVLVATVRLRSCIVVLGRPSRGLECHNSPCDLVLALSLPQLSSLRFGLVPGGLLAPLDTDTYVDFDRSVWLVEPFTLSRACAVLQQARLVPCPRSPLTTSRREAFRGVLASFIRHCRSCSL